MLTAAQKDQNRVGIIRAFLWKVPFQVGQEVLVKPGRQTGDSELTRPFLIFLFVLKQDL